MSETKTLSQIAPEYVIAALGIYPEYAAWTDAMLNPGKDFLIGDGGSGHILIGDGSAVYRLAREHIEAFQEFMTPEGYANAQKPTAILWNTQTEALSPTSRPVIELMDAQLVEQCTVLPIGPVQPMHHGADFLYLMFCVTESGHVECVQSRYMLPLQTIEGLTFWFGGESGNFFHAMQRDLCIATFAPVGVSSDGDKSLHDMQYDLARAAYAAYRETEARS